MVVGEVAYVLTTAALVLAGMAMVGFAGGAYRHTQRRAFVHLALGFTLIAAAPASTAISAFLVGFDAGESLLLVNHALTTAGYIFVVYSLLSYQRTLSTGDATTEQAVPGD